MTAFPNRKDKIKFVPSMLLKMLMAPRIWWMLSHKLVAQIIFIYSTTAFLNLNLIDSVVVAGWKQSDSAV